MVATGCDFAQADTLASDIDTLASDTVARVKGLTLKLSSKLVTLYLGTAGSYYCCTAQDSLNGVQLTAHFKVHLEKYAQGRKQVEETYTI